MKFNLSYINIFFAVFFITAVSGCSQQKNTLVSRSYHNLTSHYNGYYYAGVNLDEGIDKLERAHVDDYSKILPMFKLADEKTAKANYPSFDKAIQKTSLVITRHSMLIKGVEYCRWIDENYMLLGKAYFYKRDYFAALETFEYVARQYKTKPARFEAILWLIKTYNAMNSVMSTPSLIALIKGDPEFPKKYHADFETLQAEYFIKTENYKDAIKHLTRAIALTKKKKHRVRKVFILAQLYEEQGSLKKASQLYAQASKMHPTYDMLFNAKIKRAMTVQTSNEADTKAVKKDLNRMLKDDKNIEFRDQIYYALAEIYLKENDDKTAIYYLKKSTQASAQNTNQRALSYLKLADIYFDKPDYKNAQSYYDSTMAFIAKDYKDYNFIQNKKENLGELIKNLNIITAQDSLLKIAAMDTISRGKYIDNLIAKYVEEEKKKEEDKQNLLNNPQNAYSASSNNTTANNQPGAWYFYNPSSISFGYSDFFKKWGNRTLEDNWRRSVKESTTPENENEEIVVKDTVKTIASKDQKKNREYYTKNLPLTEEQKKKSHEKIIDAYYNAGSIYKEHIQNLPKSVETFEELDKRYPENKYLLNTFYLLYRLNLAMNEEERAAYYRKLILSKYPDTDYAKILKNPNYNKELAAEKSEIESFYDKTFDAYKKGNYSSAITMASTADSMYAKNSMAPKFAMVRALSIGKTGNVPEYESLLNKIIINYPKDPTRAKAQELLDYLSNAKKGIPDSVLTAPKDTVKKPSFQFNPNEEHLCVILIPSNNTNVNTFKAKISDFNGEYFSLDNLGITNVLYDLNYHMITITSFNGMQKAMNYFDLLKGDQNVFKNLTPSDYKIFVITTPNYQLFYKEKKTADYMVFFSENYLKKNE